MALTITQFPATASLAQSPMIFTLSESDNIVTGSAFQYYLNLQYWTGSLNDSGSAAQYTLAKYPNASRVGIFDVSKIINASLQDSRQANPSNVKYLKADAYTRYVSASVYTTGSHVFSGVYKALDGYGLFQEAIGAPIYDKSPFWPIMSDGPVTQSAFIENTGVSGIYVGSTGDNITPTKVLYRSSTGATANYNVSGNTSTNGQIAQFPIGPAAAGFPLSTIGLEWYTVEATDGFLTVGEPIRYEITCQQKYPNVRIKWKNRYGQFDYFNFYMVSKKTFSNEKRTYQPQIGTWNGSTLSYANYDSQNLNYLVDSSQTISVNSFWVSEDYNEIFKQLMVSDEIYYVDVEATDNVRPITIDTDTIDFKTKAVDKLIQYGFEFRYGQGYKLII